MLCVTLTPGVNEAAEAFKLWKSVKDSKQQTLLEKNERRPAPFKFVKVLTLLSLSVVRVDVNVIFFLQNLWL